MTHFLLAAILFVLVYALVWRPWRAYRRHLRDMRRAHEMLYPPPVLEQTPQRHDDGTTEREFDLARWRTHWHARQMVRRG